MSLTVREYRELILPRPEVSDEEANKLIDLYKKGTSETSSIDSVQKWIVRFDKHDIVNILGEAFPFDNRRLFDALIVSEYFDKFEYLDWHISYYGYNADKEEFLISLEK
ncbi:hypothetical protein BC792_11744 [Sphingobacterium allocomposti]|jgi:hypothetical protein|uniref:Uncharacterized protein n=1 Tax=Sphingobacterium allocomposti TaxID=415956 RepID=A0A5S5DCC2_9SPHI|nr:hypothetical protein [Sphingobacterium composti Yoo et al. 2007 non Ten et al. 2007]TYP92269.1 hypothetical protein BC792_11744 [Sphingobacterium composti Yoo et al. 2007 non Ten et al. 2007]HLS94565.1 hypothetical protein [Sphingobacterium sp.]